MAGSRWVRGIMVAAFLVAGCGGDGGGAVMQDGGADVDVAGGDVAVPTGDVVGPVADVGGASDSVVQDTGADVTEPPDVPVVDASAPLDVPADTSEPPVDVAAPVDTAGPVDVAEDTSPPTDLPVGAPCGDGLGTCTEGASCVPVAAGSAESVCASLATQGEPCGPGVAACASGLTCQSVDDGPAQCVHIKGELEPCGAPGEVCGPGFVCGDGPDLLGYEAIGAWTPAPEVAVDLQPARMARGAGGRLLVVDEAAHRVLLLDSDGGAIGSVGTGGDPAKPLLVAPAGVTAGPDGSAMVVDAAKKTVFSFSEADVLVLQFGQPGDGDGLFKGEPDDVARTPDGSRIYVSEPSEDHVAVYGQFGKFDSYLAEPGEGDGLLSAPTGLFATDDDVWVADALGRVQRFGADHAWLQTLELPGAGPGSSDAITDVFVNGAGRTFAAVPSAGQVAVFGPDGDVEAWLGAGELIEPWGVAAGPGQGTVIVSDVAAGTLTIFGPAFSAVCVPPRALGEPCGPGVGPCIAGGTCVPDVEDGFAGQCLSVKGQGEACAGPLSLCAKGLTCLPGLGPAGEGSECLPPAAIGALCGAGIASCGSGSSCVFESPTHTERRCRKHQGAGQPCNEYGVGACGEGLSCELAKLPTYNYFCTAQAAQGEPCGPGVAGCAVGLVCTFTDPGTLEKACTPPKGAGEPCGLGLGACVPGTACVQQGEPPTCVALGGAGVPCAVEGLPDCGPGLVCVEKDTDAAGFVCAPKATPPGDPCGPEDTCAPGAHCVADAPGADASHCYPDQPLGAACGAGAGLCEAAADCVIPDPATGVGQCLPSQLPGLGCSDEKGLCGPGAACKCSDPFTASCASTLCVPHTGPFELCIVDSKAVAPSWVGLCPESMKCGLSAVELSPGGTTISDVVLAYYRCLPWVGEGEACGPSTGACTAGLSCYCGVGKCKFDDILQGNPGVCLSAPPP